MHNYWNIFIIKLNLLCFLLLINLLTSSCGTLKGHHNIIAVDSYPRGATVTTNDQKIIGTTPFFYQIWPGQTQDILFHFNDEQQSIPYNCNLNWTQSLLPAGIMGTLPPVGTIIGGTSLLIDTLTGGIFICEKPLFAYFNKPNNVSLPKNILVLPAPVADNKLAEDIFNKWYNSFLLFNNDNDNNKDSGGRDHVLDYPTGRQELSFIGVDHHYSPNPAQIKTSFLHKIGMRHQITHLLRFSLIENTSSEEQNTPQLMFRPILYDIFTLQEVSGPPDYLKSFSIESPPYLKNKYWRWLMNAFKVLPNAIQIGNTEPAKTKVQSHIFPSQDGSITGHRHPDSIPKFFSLFSISVVDHPQFFNTWDYHLSFYPNFNSSARQNRFSSDNQHYSIKLFNFYAFYNASLTFHTSFGALGLDAGLGLIYFTGNDSQKNRYNFIDSGTRVNIHYVAFATDRFYFRFDVSSYKPHHSKINSAYYRLESWNEGYVGVGYYYPSLKNLARKLLPF